MEKFTTEKNNFDHIDFENCIKFFPLSPGNPLFQGDNYTDRGHTEFSTTFGTNRGNQVIYCCAFKRVIKIQTVVLI